MLRADTSSSARRIGRHVVPTFHHSFKIEIVIVVGVSLEEFSLSHLGLKLIWGSRGTFSEMKRKPFSGQTYSNVSPSSGLKGLEVRSLVPP